MITSNVTQKFGKQPLDHFKCYTKSYCLVNNTLYNTLPAPHAFSVILFYRVSGFVCFTVLADTDMP